jgi:hypothetical protein
MEGCVSTAAFAIVRASARTAGEKSGRRPLRIMVWRAMRSRSCFVGVADEVIRS